MAEHRVAAAEELADGEHMVVELEGLDIGVFRVDGEYHAYTSWCPHQGGPICEGSLMGTTEATHERGEPGFTLSWVKEGEVLRCPWHAWEFDVLSGECLHDDDYRLLSHSVRVEDGDVVVSI